ncbi:hypothetical protein FNF27_05890 [Cafeteria roenbergensis]|uniref:Sulfhydryl oxidase n=1 Tax=Cafeteria roenbergensis TaxID=33653 RepID=A0A5A8E4M1_CAFRO|nr:hypothetical protein FNF27_05890 [Cafeteria roenbergensis]
MAWFRAGRAASRAAVMVAPPLLVASLATGAAKCGKDRFESCERSSCASRDEVLASLRAASGVAGALPASAASKAASPECPPDREELGRSSWDLLHSMAAYYPERPSAEDKAAMAGFIRGLARFYPCSHCAEALRADVEAVPPRLGSREEFAGWVCEQHNIVNESLGKPAFKCDLATLDGRWRDGVAGCWQQMDQTAQESLGQAGEDDEDEEEDEEDDVAQSEEEAVAAAGTVVQRGGAAAAAGGSGAKRAAGDDEDDEELLALRRLLETPGRR